MRLNLLSANQKPAFDQPETLIREGNLENEGQLTWHPKLCILTPNFHPYLDHKEYI